MEKANDTATANLREERRYENKYVALHLEWESLLDHADDATVAALTRGIIKYAKHGTIPELGGLGTALFAMMRETIDRDLERGHRLARKTQAHGERCEKTPEKGGRGRKRGDYRGVKEGEEGFPFLPPKEKEKENKGFSFSSISGEMSEKERNLPTPLNPPSPHTGERKGDGRSVGYSSSAREEKIFTRKPSSYTELENYLASIGHSGFDSESFWNEMEQNDWRIPDKTSGELRPLKSWKNFLKYRIESNTPDNTAPKTQSPDSPVFSTPEEKKLYEEYLRGGYLCSFECFKLEGHKFGRRK